MFDVPLPLNNDVPDVLGCSGSSESSEALEVLGTRTNRNYQGANGRLFVGTTGSGGPGQDEVAFPRQRPMPQPGVKGLTN